VGESAGSVFEFPVFEDVGSSFLEMSPVLRPSLLEVPFFGFVGGRFLGGMSWNRKYPEAHTLESMG